MENPKISVIVPVYNVESYLEDALNSLKEQTFAEEMEVLMIDDGSTDKSRYIIEKYASEHENFYAYHKPNEGAGIARNFGLILAKGEYIHFMDADDFIFHDAYEKLYDLASKTGCDFVTASFLRYGWEKAWPQQIANFVFNGLEENIENTNAFEYPNLFWDMPVWNKLYRRDFLIKNKIEFPNWDLLFEDNVFSNEAALKAEKISILKDFIYCWRVRNIGSSSTQSSYLNRGKDLCEMAKMVNKLLIENVKNEEILNIKYQKLLRVDIPFYLQSVRNYSNEDKHIVFEGAQELLNLVPDRFIKNLNNYYQAVYEMLKNGDWDDLLAVINGNLRRNPRLLKGINEKYAIMFDFEKDAIDEELFSYTNDISLKENCIAIDFTNYIPFYREKGDEEINVILKNKDFDDALFDSSYMKGNLIYLPTNAISFGENIVFTYYKSKGFEKQDSIKTDIYKTFRFDDFDIDIARGQTGYLRIIKRKKGSANILIESIEPKDNKFIFKGVSDSQIEKIELNDCLDFYRMEYSVESNSNGTQFSFELDCNDFHKAPIQKWELIPSDDFNTFNLKKEHKFFKENHIITIKNFNNRIRIEFARYDSIKELQELNQELSKLKVKNNKLSKKNKKLKKTLNAYKSRKAVKFVDKLYGLFK